MNEIVKKSLEKSKNVLKEKRKIVRRKICIQKTHVNNNCYELRSRAIKKTYTNFNGNNYCGHYATKVETNASNNQTFREESRAMK